MWYKQAKPLVDSGKLAILGVIQEQHADRAQLYKQWKEFDFPIVQDATTQLDLAVVPIPLLIDEHGVVRNNRPRPTVLQAFVESEFDLPEKKEQQASVGAAVNESIDRGNAALHSRDINQLATAIKSFADAVTENPKNGKALFGLGVAYRTRFDSSKSESGDFENASKYWSQALATNPNQYIWRRRIEQYGPRQIKPYPFYDWVDDAQQAVKKRGEEPVEIVAPLSGAEIAKPSKKIAEPESTVNPDPDSKIFGDESNMVSIAATTVPATVKKGSTVRIHLDFSIGIGTGKWNDEAPPLQVWINNASSGKPESRLLTHNGAKNKAGHKYLDFEFATDKNADDCQITGYALYHTCDDEGVCYYFRQDFSVPVKTR